jgi:2-C-methyl-D-erythritol 4-phosphate cytidylyltransferase
VSRRWGDRNRCGGSRAAAEPVASTVILAIEPQATVVSRLRVALDAQPRARRFVLQGEEPARLEESEAAPVAVYGAPVGDTCKEVVDGRVRATVPRERLVMLQGPWVFTREALADTLERVDGRDTEIVDLTAFCEAARVRVRVLPAR